MPEHRPVFHFLPPSNWMNDPNGLIKWKGRYHLFYQYNPSGAFHGSIHWGHAVSGDLVHWEDLPMALAPTPGGVDAGGCWSGCVVDADGVPTLFYTGVHPQVQCMATSRDDDLRVWHKSPDNPLIDGPPPDLSIPHGDHPEPEFRDPWVWRGENGQWYMLVGSGIAGQGGTALLYRSPDLHHWAYMHPILTGVIAGDVWECPVLFPLAGQHVLLTNAHPEFQHTYYTIGAYDKHRFRSQHTGLTDQGTAFYAAQVLQDEERWLMWGWLKEQRSPQAQLEAGWSGVMSLPRELGLTPEGELSMHVAPELRSLREGYMGWQRLRITADSPLMDIQGDCLEMRLRLATQHPMQIAMRCSPDEQEVTRLRLSPDAIVLDTTRSSLAPEAPGEVIEVGRPDGEIRLHIFIDRSVVEVFVNRTVAITARVYPTREDSLGVNVKALGPPVEVAALDAWSLRSIWPEERPELSLSPPGEGFIEGPG